MPKVRSLFSLMIVLGLLATLVPAVALATSGSAGDNQYVDPLAGVHGKGSSGSTSSGSSAGAATGTSAVPVVTTPTATVAATAGATTTGSTASGPSAKTLPFTGVEDWEIAGLGVLMLVSGFGLRRGTRA